MAAMHSNFNLTFYRFDTMKCQCQLMKLIPVVSQMMRCDGNVNFILLYGPVLDRAIREPLHPCDTAPDCSSIDPLPSNFRIQFNVLMIIYRVLCGQAPTCIRDLLQPHVSSGSLRFSDEGLLVATLSTVGFKTKVHCVFKAVPP